MPCFTVREVSAVLEAREPEMLAEALKAMGYSVVMEGGVVYFRGRHNGVFADGRYEEGRLVYEGEVNLDSVKESYSARLIVRDFSSVGKITMTGPGVYIVEAR